MAGQDNPTTTSVSTQPLCLADLNTLCRHRYLVTDLSPNDLAHFPENTLGGAYFQYMNDGKFSEFDKNPMTPDSDVKKHS